MQQKNVHATGECMYKVWVLEQSHSTMLSRVSHMAILSVITRVMSVRNQTNQASVTSSGPLCDYSCKFVHEPKKVKSTNEGQRSAFQDILKKQAFDNSPTVSSSVFFQKLMVSKTWNRDFVPLLNLFVCQFAIPSHAYLHHVKEQATLFA